MSDDYPCEGDDCSQRAAYEGMYCRSCRCNRQHRYECRNCGRTYVEDRIYCTNCRYSTVEPRFDDTENDDDEPGTTVLEGVGVMTAMLADHHDGDVPKEEREMLGELFEIAGEVSDR